MLVLLVDGSAAVRARLRERIVDDETDVEEATDGRSACAIAQSNHLDIIIVDIHVRADTGLELLTRLRGQARGALIIVLTNEASDVSRRECLRHGANHFLDKSREFDRAIELVVRARAANRATRP